LEFEPQQALYAPQNGLLFYEQIPKLWKSKLKPNGILAFEVGIHQAKPVAALLKQNGFHQIQIIKDFGGIDRVVSARA
jgi:release factor glutamine methyltransferase